MLPIYWSIPFIVEFIQVNNFTLYLEFTQKAAVLENNTCTEAGALFLLGRKGNHQIFPSFEYNWSAHQISIWKNIFLWKYNQLNYLLFLSVFDVNAIL